MEQQTNTNFTGDTMPGMMSTWNQFISRFVIPVIMMVFLAGCKLANNPVIPATIQMTPLTDTLMPVDVPPTLQPTEIPINSTNTWIRKFEGPEYGAFFDFTLCPDGNFLVVGATNHLHVPPYSGDALIIKMTLAGDVLWERTWGGEGYEQALSVVLADDGGYFIFGETDSLGAGGRDFFLLKVSGDGTEEWYRTYGKINREWPFGMIQLENHDLLMFGFSETESGNMRNQYVVRTGTDGEVVWEYIGDSPEEELVLDVLETAEGDLILVVNVAEDGKLVKLDADGNILWSQRYEIPGWQYASGASQLSDGGFLLAGFSMSSVPTRQADTWLARCNADGELEWQTSFGEPSFDDYANVIIQLKDGTFLVGGISNGMLLSRIDIEGNVLWRRSLVGTTVFGAMALHELDDGGFLVAGLINLIDARSYDAIILRSDADGMIRE